MILKASARGGAKQLGLHLLRTDENEHVSVHEVRGFVSGDVVGALKEAQAVAKGTRAKQFLFSVSLNPPQDKDVSIETFEAAIERIEERNGLTSQPRIIVFHEKEARRHAHAVWSRTDIETMTARPLPFYKTKLREISKELYLENDWQMPRGFMDSREADPRNFTLAEWQQAKRGGYDPRAVKQAIQECWAVSDSKDAFTHALEDRGLRLAKGDRRGHVAVTHHGEVLSLAKVTGKKAKEVRAKLGEPDSLSSVDETKARIASELTPGVQRLLGEADRKAGKALSPLIAQRREMTASHRAERETLSNAQQTRWDTESKERSEKLNKGLKGLWQRLSGEHGRIVKENQSAAMQSLQRDREQRERLIFAQAAERRRLQESISAGRKAHAKDLADLHRDLTRLRRGELPVPPEWKKPEREAPRPDRSPMQRTWRQAASGDERPETARQRPSTQDRLERLRTAPRSPRTRDRGPEHER
ncbi:MAG: relaxase [Parvibaculum sp.]|uniref:relaxase/mobilization nuclease domain-containing protein n=1 Tax=Parvibaculum sp. TaxID=2024848 RepID=UPI0032646662